jgi:NDP-sugar pyrophosphorylase family protein
MKAVILAGGLGSRLKPFTNVIPKPLIPIAGEKTVLEIQIAALKKYGFEEIYIATNYKAELIESYLGNGSKYGIKLIFSKENKPLGTCGPLSLLKNQLDEPFLLMNGDILTELNFRKFTEFAAQCNALLTVVTKEITTPFDFGNVILENDRIVKIEEKPDIRFIIVAGIYLLKPGIFKYIPDNQYFGIDELIKILVEKNVPVASYLTRDYWVDIGRMDDLNEVIKRYQEGS